MGKPLKKKKDKVQKISEEEYAKYIASLRDTQGNTQKTDTSSTLRT